MSVCVLCLYNKNTHVFGSNYKPKSAVCPPVIVYILLSINFTKDTLSIAHTHTHTRCVKTNKMSERRKSIERKRTNEEEDGEKTIKFFIFNAYFIFLLCT